MLDSNTTVDIWKKFPFSHLEVQSFKKSWAWKDSYVKLKKKKKKGTEERHSILGQPIQKSYLLKFPTKTLLSIKLTYFHLVQKKICYFNK